MAFDNRPGPAHSGGASPPDGSGPQPEPLHEGAIDTRQQLSVFFPSGVDAELESVLKPLIDGTYEAAHPDGHFHPPAITSVSPATPAAHAMRPTPPPTPLPMPPHQPPVAPFPGTLPPSPSEHEAAAFSPFPIGGDWPPPEPRTGNSGTLRHLQNEPAEIGGATSPLAGQVPVAVAVARSTTGPSATTGTLASFAAHSTGPLLRGYTTHQLVQALVSRIVSGIPQNAVLERTPDIEQMLAGRFMAALSQVPGPVPAGNQPTLFNLVLDEILGYGPLEPLMRDPAVTEIMVNGHEQVWAERNGQMIDTGVKFGDEEHLLRIAGRMAMQMGRRLDRRWPMLDGRLPDGARVNIIAPPCAVNGTSITVRKLAGVPLSISTLVDYGTLDQRLADFLRACIGGRLNILIAGGSGSGKTTLLNGLASFIPPHERIVTIEESAELRLEQKHVVSLETRLPDHEHPLGEASEVTLRHLLANALRMKCDRIVLGQLCGAEALDLVQAMTTGHDGVLTSIHAITPRDALTHLEAMALMSGTSLPARYVREAIATAVDMVVQVARLRDGTRRVIYVTEVRGMEGETIALRDLFRWQEIVDEETGIASGVLQPAGHTPRFIYRLQDRGYRIERSIFGA